MVIGLQKQWQILKGLAEAGKLPHALLFAGPEKIGKKALAIELAKFIFCQEENVQARPCQKCRACQDVQNNVHPDLVTVLPEEGSIKIAQVRNLEWHLSLKAYSAKIKVGIIDDIHLAQSDAQNSLLKTLEEPKGDTLLILITSSPKMLLRTVFSRVQMMKFPLSPDKEIEDYLIGLGADKTNAREVTELSFGRPGQAVDFFRDPQKMAGRQIALKEIKEMIKAKIPQKFAYAKKISDSPETINEILDLWERQLRQLLIEGQKASPDFLKSVKSLEETIYFIKTTNVNQRLALENFMLNLSI